MQSIKVGTWLHALSSLDERNKFLVSGLAHLKRYMFKP